MDLRADPLAPAARDARDPFDSNQAIPTVLFGRARGRSAFAREFPQLEVRAVEHLAGPSYAASGGFSRGALVPQLVWNALHAVEARLPEPVFRALGFRMLVTLEKR